MSRFRNPDSVTLLGTAITGVQSIALRAESREIAFEGDDDPSPQDLGVTGVYYAATIEVLSSLKCRDIYEPKWTDKNVPTETEINEVRELNISLDGTPVQDSAETDVYLTFIDVRSITGEAEVTFRDVAQLLSDVFKVGERGKLTWSMPKPKTTAGVPDLTDLITGEIDNLVIRSRSPNIPHGEMAECTVRCGGHGTGGAAASITCSELDKSPGDTGSLVFTAKSADGGSDAVVTVANGVCVRATLRPTHGGILQVTYEVQFYSSDGTTSPVSVA